MKFFLKKKKKKSYQKGKNLQKSTKIYQKVKNKNWLSVEKNIVKWEKAPHYN